ncbi:MAG: MFS transporter [Pseudomonadota bacterium]|nr:MFS transporter [Pseudomonadota bacterium]
MSAPSLSPPPAAPAGTPVGAGSAASREGVRGLALLLVVYIFNFLDRNLILMQFGSIKSEFHLSDTQLALLGTTSFVIFYTLLGVPFGRLADRVPRTKMIAVGLATWSLFSGLTGFANDFWSLFACRVMVGVGEATLGPAALSLLSDWFAPRVRATVQSVYSAGVPLGAAAAFFLGGWIGQEWGWRSAFYVLGFPGLLLAGLMWMLPEPARGASAAAATATPGAPPEPTEPTPSAWAALRVLAAAPALRWHLAGYAMFAAASYALSIWVPKMLELGFKVEKAEIGLLAGLGSLFAGGLATAFGGWAADKFRARHPGGRMRFSALCAAGCAPLWLALLHSGNLPVMFGAYVLLLGLGLAWLGPAAADLVTIAGPLQRGMAVGVYLFVVNLVGYGLVPPLTGLLADTLGGAAVPMAARDALMYAPVCCVAASLLLWRGSRLVPAV